MPYANDVFSALQAEAEEGLEEEEAGEDTDGEAQPEQEQPGRTEPVVEDQSPAVNLETTPDDEFTNLSPLA